MNVGSIGILGILGISLDKIGYGSIKIIMNKGLEKVSLSNIGWLVDALSSVRIICSELGNGGSIASGIIFKVK